MINLQRYMVVNQGADTSIANKAIGYTYNICQQNNWNNVHIICPIAKHFNGSIVSTALNLKYGKILQIKGITISVGIQKNLSRHKYNMLFCAYIRPDDMNKIDRTAISDPTIAAIFFLPHSIGEGQVWATAYNPQILP